MGCLYTKQEIFTLYDYDKVFMEVQEGIEDFQFLDVGNFIIYTNL